MADLPRYQMMGVQVADLPRMSTAPQQAAAQGFDMLSRNLDRMFSYAEEAAVTEAKRQAIKYAVDNPPTEEQLKTAISNPESLKIKGAGRIFQQTYQEAAAARLSPELLLKASEEADRIEMRFQKGEITAAQSKQLLADLMDGQSAAIIALSPEYSLKHRASLASVARTSFSKISDIELKGYIAEKKKDYDKALVLLGKQIEDTISYEIDKVNVDTGKPVNINEAVFNRLQPFEASIAALGGDREIWNKAMVIAESAKANAIVKFATSSEFGENRLDKLNKIQSGDFGKMSPVWKSMSLDQQKVVQKSISEQFAFEKNVRDNFLAQEQFSANEILRQMYMSNSPGKYFNQLNGLVVDPATLKSAKEYVDNFNTQGAKVDDLRTLSDLSRRIAAGTATENDVIAAQKSGKLKNDTAKSLVINIANPSDDVNWGLKYIESSLNIQNAQLPPEITSKEGRSIAVNMKGQSDKALRIFATTPDENGKFPTPKQIRDEAKRIGDGARTLILPYLVEANDKAAESVKLQLSELANVDLADDQAFNNAIAQAIKNKKSESSISAAKIARQRWLDTQKKIEAK